MHKLTRYISKKPDAQGYCDYSDHENETWKILYDRQIEVVEHRACPEFIEGLAILNMTADCIPQLPEVNKTLRAATGWAVEPVNALIAPEKFFGLLAAKKFPAATFVREREELDYLQGPDIFHELFGHCPLLTNPNYSYFVEQYGKYCVKANVKQRAKLLRLFWLTIEFGLVETTKGLRIYGGGILSSKEETEYALASDVPQRKPFDIVEALRTPYRIDVKQPIYFIIPHLDSLYKIMEQDLLVLISQATELGDYDLLV